MRTVCGVLLAAVLVIPPAQAQVDRQFIPLLYRPYRIAIGPDGYVWVTTAASFVIRLHPVGTVQYFPVPGPAFAVLADPAGGAWYGRERTIGKISNEGAVTEFHHPEAIFIFDLTFDRNGTVRYATYTPVPPYFNPVLATGIAMGPDRNIWIRVGPYVGRVEDTGTRWFSVGNSYPGDVVSGPDGNMWADGGIISISGTLIPLRFSASELAVGADGAIWGADPLRNQIVRISMDGRIQELPHPSPWQAPWSIAAAPDGGIWVNHPRGLVRFQPPIQFPDMTFRENDLVIEELFPNQSIGGDHPEMTRYRIGDEPFVQPTRDYRQLTPVFGPNRILYVVEDQKRVVKRSQDDVRDFIFENGDYIAEFQFDAAGNLLIVTYESLSVPFSLVRVSPAGEILSATVLEDVLFFWSGMELDRDQCTLYYINDQAEMVSLDLCTGKRRLLNIATGCFPGWCGPTSFRVLPDGSFLIPYLNDVKRVLPGGVVVATYDAPGEDMFSCVALANDGKTFFAGGKRLHRFDVESAVPEGESIQTYGRVLLIAPVDEPRAGTVSLETQPNR